MLFFLSTNVFRTFSSLLFSKLSVYVHELAGNAFALPSAEEKPVRGQRSKQEGSGHISIFISFSGTFTDLLVVSLVQSSSFTRFRIISYC